MRGDWNHKAWFRNERLASGIVCSCTYDRVRVICLTMRAFCSAVSRRDCCNTETAAVPWHLLIPDDWQRGKAEGSWGMPAVRKAVWLFAVSCCRPNASAQRLAALFIPSDSCDSRPADWVHVWFTNPAFESLSRCCQLFYLYCCLLCTVVKQALLYLRRLPCFRGCTKVAS